MKAEEGKLKWQMKRVEEKQRMTEATEDVQEVSKWRQEQAKELTQCDYDRNKIKKKELLDEHKKYQAFKKEKKNERSDTNMKLVTKEYEALKIDSQYATEMKKELPIKEREMMINANCDNYTMVAEYSLEDSLREKEESRLSRNEEEDLNLGAKMLEARKERDAAFQSLQLLRSQQHLKIDSGAHIPTRPFIPDTVTM